MSLWTYIFWAENQCLKWVKPQANVTLMIISLEKTTKISEFNKLVYLNKCRNYDLWVLFTQNFDFIRVS